MSCLDRTLEPMAQQFPPGYERPAPIQIADYDPTWPSTFAALRAHLATALSPFVLRIEHVGSTAVPGLAAKPIVDLDVGVATADWPIVIQRLASLGYQHQGDLGIPGREAFRTPPADVAHHRYLCAPDSAELARHLAFRDALRAEASTARAYAELKQCLARQYAEDRLTYSEAKTDFVRAVLASAPRRQGR